MMVLYLVVDRLDDILEGFWRAAEVSFGPIIVVQLLSYFFSIGK
jgi:hypothetical protein